MTATPTIPPLGLGTYSRWKEEGIAAMLKAVEIGYRHIDTAQTYNNEVEVGEVVRRAGLPRQDLFITTKVADTRLAKRDFFPSVEESLGRLRLDQVDLLLIHWPSHNDQVPLEDYMTALVEAQERGLTRLIGVSNFTIDLLRRTDAIIGPGRLATNQVEIHPFLQQPRLRDYARSVGLKLTAYQPIARAATGEDATVNAIAEKHGVTPAAISLAFLMAEGHIAIPASGKEENLRANYAAHGVTLDSADIAAIRALDRGIRRINPAKGPKWDD